MSFTSHPLLRQSLHCPDTFARHFLEVELHTNQARWLRNSTQRENLLVTGNRWGKSYASAVKLIHHAIFQCRDPLYDFSGRYRACCGSITQDQANLVFKTVLRLLRQSPLLAPAISSVVVTPYPVVTLANGATIESRSTQNRGEYLLGNDYDLFIFDEAAFDPDPEYVVEEILTMRLADRGGKLDLVSTPNGKNWFYLRAREIIEGRRPGYFQNGDSRENYFISKEFLEERVVHFSEARLQQNIMGQFVDTGGEILKGAYVDSAMERYQFLKSHILESSPSVGEQSSRVAISGWDLARKQTATVGITVMLVDDVAVVAALERFRHFEWTQVLAHICARQVQYPGRLVIDATGLGDVIAEQLIEYNPETVIFTAASKAELLTNLELLHAQGRVAYPRHELPDGAGKIWALEDELRRARWDNNNDCDALMALALAVWPLRKRESLAIPPRVGKV